MQKPGFKTIGVIGIFVLCANITAAQGIKREGGDPKLSEYWDPEPVKVTPGKTNSDAPSDAIILFDGKDFSKWKAQNGNAVKWTIADGAMTVAKGTGMITSTEAFGDCQLHIEWRAPAEVKGTGQGRGNSGIFLMGKYELQVLDSYNNRTYANGQAGSIYKQLPPLANANREPGTWQAYDVIFTAPRFSESGIMKTPARITVIHNGVVVQNNSTLWGPTEYIGAPVYVKHGEQEPISLQDHGDAVSFRNIWVRRL